MSYMVDHHRVVSDPFGQADQPAHFGLMMTLTRGATFPWRQGGVALLRRELYPQPHAWTYCGLAIGADTQIKNYPGMTHKADQAYQYTAVRFLGNGMISEMFPPIRIDFDAGVNRILPAMPNAPVGVVAEPLAGGKVLVQWEYVAHGHGDYPTDFQVFSGPTVATIDYETPLVDSDTALNTVAYSARQVSFSFTSAALADLSSHAFAVRGRNSGGVAEKNQDTTDVVVVRNVSPTASSAAISAEIAPYSRIGV